MAETESGKRSSEVGAQGLEPADKYTQSKVWKEIGADVISDEGQTVRWLQGRRVRGKEEAMLCFLFYFLIVQYVCFKEH